MSSPMDLVVNYPLQEKACPLPPIAGVVLKIIKYLKYTGGNEPCREFKYLDNGLHNIKRLLHSSTHSETSG